MISFRLAQVREFNDAPRIAKKVKGTEKEKLGDNHLVNLKYLDLENPDGFLFTGQKLDAKNTSIDHIIPWSYLFSDDLWNLVYVNRSYNSSKSNKLQINRQLISSRNVMSGYIIYSKHVGQNTKKLTN